MFPPAFRYILAEDGVKIKGQFFALSRAQLAPTREVQI